MNVFRTLLIALATGVIGVLPVAAAQIEPQEPAPSVVAQDLQPDQTSTTNPSLPSPGEVGAIRPGINYLGVGINVGLGGRGTDPLGGSTVGGLAAKFRVVNARFFEVSFRPSILLATDSLLLLTGTVDFIQAGEIDRRVVPFVGAGGAVGTGANNGAFVLNGGVDVRLTEMFTGFAQFNFGFFSANTTSASLLLGAGVNF